MSELVKPNVVLETGAQQAPTVHSLSCTNCRAKKIRCNKVQPCDPCRRNNQSCIFPNRLARKRKASPNARSASEAELRRRLRQLEHALEPPARHEETDADTSTAESVSTVSSGPASRATIFRGSSEAQLTSGSVQDQYISFVNQEQRRHHVLNSDFWSKLKVEFSTLQQLLDDLVEEEESPEIVESDVERHADLSPSVLLSALHEELDLRVLYPSDNARAILLQTYFANVDPVCKLLHRPTAAVHFAAIQDLSNPETGRVKFASLEAVAFAIYLTAVVSMPSQQCEAYFGEQKHVLVSKYKHGTEAALAKAGYLNTTEVITLQALTLYVVGLRADDTTQSSWALIGLCVRLAQGCGLHLDGEGEKFSPFEAEMRRRLWWQIVVLDVTLANDRGSELLIGPQSFTTRMPHNIDDDELGLHYSRPVRGRQGITETTLSLLNMEAAQIASKLGSESLNVPNLEDALSPRMELINIYVSNTESNYFIGKNPSSRSRYLQAIAQILMLRLCLLAQYPLRRHSENQQGISASQSLRMVRLLLSSLEYVDKYQEASSFNWWMRTYIPWHPLAIGLSIICSDSTIEGVEEAWPVMERSYELWSQRLSHPSKGSVWWPVVSLMAKARKLLGQERPQRAHQLPENAHSAGQSRKIGHQTSVSSPISDTTQAASVDQATVIAMDLSQDAVAPGETDFTFDWAGALTPFYRDISEHVKTSNVGPVNWEEWNMMVDGLRS